jgi:hypothetical protein
MATAMDGERTLDPERRAATARRSSHNGEGIANDAPLQSRALGRVRSGAGSPLPPRSGTTGRRAVEIAEMILLPWPTAWSGACHRPSMVGVRPGSHVVGLLGGTAGHRPCQGVRAANSTPRLSVCFGCPGGFEGMLEMFHVDIAKVDPDVVMLQTFQTRVASV